MRRRGFSLVELLVGLILLAMLGLAITRTLAGASQSTTRALRALSVDRTMMATGALLREELGLASSAELALASGTAVDFSRPVGHGTVCGGAGTRLELRLSEWWGIRWPEEGRDRVVLLLDPLAATWVGAAIDSVGAGHCDDGGVSIRLTLDSTLGASSIARVVEPVRLRGYLSGGDGWWGLAPASGLSSVQPFAGPLATPLQSASLTDSLFRLVFRPIAGRDTAIRIPLGVP